MAPPLRFGLNADPNTGGLAIAERITAIADTSGLELVGIQDHPYNPDFVDSFSLITWLAATINGLSGGRFELGLGAGAFADGITGMGGPARSAGQAREALSEAIDIIRATWAGEPFGYHTESGMNAFVFWPSGDRERQSRVFAEEVVPAVRAAVPA